MSHGIVIFEHNGSNIYFVKIIKDRDPGKSFIFAESQRLTATLYLVEHQQNNSFIIKETKTVKKEDFVDWYIDPFNPVGPVGDLIY